MSRLTGLLVLILLAGAACNSRAPKNEGQHQNAEETSLQKNLTPYARPASEGGTSGGYFIYKNDTGNIDTLHSVHSPAAAMAEVHEMYKSEDDMMNMRQVQKLTVLPGDSVIFKPGAMHIMLMQLNRDLLEGDSVEVTLEFARAGSQTFSLPVKLN